MENSHHTAKSELNIVENGKGSFVKAVVVATVLDIFGTILLSVILIFFYNAIMAGKGLTSEEILRSFEQLDRHSSLYLIGASLGLLITFFSGYLCVKISKYNGYRLVTIYLLLTIIICLNLVGNSGDFSAGEIMQTMGAGYLGAWAYIRNTKKRRTQE